MRDRRKNKAVTPFPPKRSNLKYEDKDNDDEKACAIHELEDTEDNMTDEEEQNPSEDFVCAAILNELQRRRNISLQENPVEDFVRAAIKKGLRKRCEIANKPYVALLDSGAYINLVNRRIVKRARLNPRPANKTIQVVVGGLKLSEIVDTAIKVGRTKTKIMAFVVDKQPFDIMLGQPFLEKHSPAYMQMYREFPEAVLPDDSTSACPVYVQVRLQAILDEHPNLILEKDQLPPPDRVYDEQEFELGLPDELRDKTFFRAQYPPNPMDIDKIQRRHRAAEKEQELWSKLTPRIIILSCWFRRKMAIPEW